MNAIKQSIRTEESHTGTVLIKFEKNPFSVRILIRPTPRAYGLLQVDSQDGKTSIIQYRGADLKNLSTFRKFLQSQGFTFTGNTTDFKLFKLFLFSSVKE